MPPGHGTLRVSARSIVLVVAGLGATLLVLRMAVAAERVIGWIAAAAGIALLLTPVVDRLRRWMPRGAAVLVVVLLVLGGAGLAGYGVGASLVRQYDGLRVAAPRAAERLERSERYGDVARDAMLSQRTREFVDAIPAKLRGGDAAEAVRAAATRGIAFVATAILSLFFLLHGPRLLWAAVAQLPGPLQPRVREIGGRAATRASRYALLTLAQACVAGLVGYAVARVLAVPSAAALGLWVGLWAVVPLVGAFVGALPIVAIAAAQEPWHGVVAVVVFVAYQIAENVLSERQIHRRTMRLGPFLTTLAGAAGLELYGLGGALVLTLALALVVAVLSEVAALREADEAAADAAEEEAAEGEVEPEPGRAPLAELPPVTGPPAEPPPLPAPAAEVPPAPAPAPAPAVVPDPPKAPAVPAERTD